MENSALKFGLQPFWFWNGDMKPEEIIRQIREMNAKGVPGFLIHPRQGMEIPYMSEEFFRRVRLAVDTARDCGMEVWLYDEYPYPSGVCAGEVMLEHPEYLCRQLNRSAVTAEGGREVRLSAPWGRVVLARAFRIRDGIPDLEDHLDLTEYVGTAYQQEVFQYSGLTRYNKKRYFTGDAAKCLCWTPPDGQWRVYLVTESVKEHFKYFDHFVDTLNPEAIQCFLRLTHERYKEHIGDEFGRTVKGFFSDEITAFPDKQPWSPLLPGLVAERYGIDLVSCLPALWEDLGEISSRVRYAYWSTAADRFIECYDKAVYEWCDRNGLLYIGEKPIMRSKELRYMHIPGIDTGHQKAGSRAKMVGERYRSNGKIVSSAAHFYDKPAALCEAGHSIGWGMTIQDLKWILDWLAVQGVDFYVIHGFFYTTDGLKKHDAPPSAFYQMPWWEDAAGLAAYAKRLGDLLRSIQRQVRILILDPVTSVWTSDAEEKQRMQQDLAALENRMLCEELDHYIIDPELFAEGEIVRTGAGDAENGRPRFKIHGETYDVVLLPPMRNLEAAACEKVLEFAACGGLTGALASVAFERIEDSDAVTRLGAVFGVDGRKSWEAYQSGVCLGSRESGNAFFAADIEAMCRWLKRNVPCRWRLEAEDGLGRDEVPSVCGIDKEGRDRLFIVNTSAKTRVLTVRDPAGGQETVTLAPFESRTMGCGGGGNVSEMESGSGQGSAQRQDVGTGQETDSGQGGAREQGITQEQDAGFGQEIARRQGITQGQDAGFGQEIARWQGIAQTRKAGPALENEPKKMPRTAEAPVIEVPIDSEMPFSLSNQNALRLGTWTARLPDGQTGVVEAAPLIDQLEAGGFLRPVRQKNFFGCPKELEFEGTRIDFSVEFDCHGLEQFVSGRIWLVVEPETFVGKWEIHVNDMRVCETDLVRHEAYLPTNLAADVTGALHEGRNRIRVSVETEVSFGGMRGPLYLFGDFAVGNENGIWKLTPLPEKADMEDPASAGLPFYYGEIRYRRPLPAACSAVLSGSGTADERSGERTGGSGSAVPTVVFAITAPWLTDSVRLRIGGYETAPCSWQPYRFEIPAALLRDEGAQLEIAVRGTALGLFEGQRFDRKSHAYVDPFQ